jgi:TolB-like protein
VELYHSDFLSGFLLDSNSTFSEWQYFQAEGLRKRIIAILDRLVDGHVATGELGVAITYARRRLGIDPVDESAHRRLMRLYAATGQYTLAVRQYRDCCRRLEREIGVKPDEKTDQLYRDVAARRPVAVVDPRQAEESRPGEATQSAPATVGLFPRILRSRWGVIAVCAAALLVVGAGALAIASAAASARPRTIAVFPIPVRSDDGAPDSFGLGLAESITKELAGVRRMEVRIGARAAPDQREDPASLRAAAIATGVSFYVEGSVFKVNEQVLVSLRLVNVRSGVILWQDSYNRPLVDPFALQSAIAADARAQIAERLGLQ